MKTKNIATFGMMIALAFILSYIESIIPMPVAIPGIKLGLANLVVLTALYNMGAKEAFVLSLIRIVLVGFTFGSPSTMLFSLAGGLLSWALMVLLRKVKSFGMVGVSVAGGIAHNVGQILTAIWIVDNATILYYLPFLLISGVVTGAVIGIVGSLIVNSIKKYRLINED